MAQIFRQMPRHVTSETNLPIAPHSHNAPQFANAAIFLFHNANIKEKNHKNNLHPLLPYSLQLSPSPASSPLSLLLYPPPYSLTLLLYPPPSPLTLLFYPPSSPLTLFLYPPPSPLTLLLYPPPSEFIHPLPSQLLFCGSSKSFKKSPSLTTPGSKPVRIFLEKVIPALRPFGHLWFPCLIEMSERHSKRVSGVKKLRHLLIAQL